MINYITLIVALCLSGVAAWYSIVGLTTIFSGAFIPVLIMGSVLELAKVVTTSWLYHNWDSCPRIIKYYLCSAVVVLVFITSMGIFGFLSKAHIEAAFDSSIPSEQISILDQKILFEKQKIEDAKLVLSQLDSSVKVLIDAQRIRGANGAIALRQSQKDERDTLIKDIDTSTASINQYTLDKTELTQKIRNTEVEIGPVKYITQLFYDTEDKNVFDKTVRYVILILIFVFDPLALLLLTAANVGMNRKDKTDAKTICLRKDDIVWANSKDVLCL